MIDFKNDGEFKAPEAASLTGHAIIGLGSAGVNIVDQLVLDHHENTSLFCFDTDEQIIRGSVVADKMLLGGKRIHGLGTGGDPSLALEVICEEKREVIELLQGVRTAVLITGLGGGTGSGMVLEFTQLLKQLGVMVLVVAVTPFDFEGKRRLALATKALTEVKKQADAVLCLSNSRLLHASGSDVDVRQGFATMNGLVGRVCLNLRAVLHRKGPMQIHLSDLKNLLTEHDGGDGTGLENCWAGFGVASGSDRAREVVDEVLGSPLFLDGQAWSKGTAVLACLSGGRDLAMSEFQAVIEYLKQEMPVELPILAGTVLDAYDSDSLSLTLMVIGQGVEVEETPKAKSKEEFNFEVTLSEEPQEELAAELTPISQPLPNTEEARLAMKRAEHQQPKLTEVQENETTEELVEESEAKLEPVIEKPQHREQKYFVKQDELPLDKKVFRGRFEKSVPTILGGQDLDQPTFLRQNIKIRL